MEIKYKLYPYPVLWSLNDDYNHSAFSADIKARNEYKKTTITADFDLTNDDLSRYISEGKAEYLIHIECSLTAYRKVLTSSDKHVEIVIDDTQLNGKISICPFIVAKTDILNYSNSDFNQDYLGATFNVEKGAILAVSEQVNINLTKDFDELANLPSIFTICKKDTTDPTPMEVELDSEKIRINLNSVDFKNYQIMCKMNSMLPVLHTLLIFPTLVFVFEKLRTDYNEYEDYRWFRGINAALKKVDITFDEDTLNNKTSIELAQVLLALPIRNAFSAIVSRDSSEDDDV